MRNHLVVRWVVFALLTGCGLVMAADQGAKIRDRISSLGVEPDSITESPVDGLYEVMVGPTVMYVTGDGRYLVRGDIIDLEKKENLTEPRTFQARRKAIEEIGEDNMVVFGPDDARHTINVFTDIDCGYCRKMHSEIDEYNKQGIRVRYLMYPRAGLNSPSYQKAVGVWCSEDRKKALTLAKQGTDPKPGTCDNPVKSHMELGELLGVSGTPTIVLDSGEIVPGYVPASVLGPALDKRSAETAQ
jgi:thiol:disulfide interchange protein DsbC